MWSLVTRWRSRQGLTLPKSFASVEQPSTNEPSANLASWGRRRFSPRPIQRSLLRVVPEPLIGGVGHIYSDRALSRWNARCLLNFPTTTGSSRSKLRGAPILVGLGPAGPTLPQRNR